MLDDRTAELLRLIYDGIDDPPLWERAIVNLRDRVDAELIFMARMDMTLTEPEETWAWGAESARFLDGLEEHRTETYKIDPGLYYAISRPEGGNFKLSEADPAASPDLESWRKWQRGAFGSTDHHSRYTSSLDDLSFVLAVHAKSQDGVLSAETESLHGLVFEHMSRAVRLASRQPNLIDGPKPLILVDAQGMVRQANRAAEEVLARNDGLSVRNGQLVGRMTACTKRIELALSGALSALEAGRVGGVAVLERAPGHAPYRLTVTPLPMPPEPFRFVGPSALVRIADPDQLRTGLEPPTLMAMFGLTEREAQLAALFAGSVSDLPTAATRLGVSYETARSFLKAVLAKCEVRNQVELAQLLTQLT